MKHISALVWFFKYFRSFQNLFLVSIGLVEVIREGCFVNFCFHHEFPSIPCQNSFCKTLFSAIFISTFGCVLLFLAFHVNVFRFLGRFTCDIELFSFYNGKWNSTMVPGEEKNLKWMAIVTCNFRRRKLILSSV